MKKQFDIIDFFNKRGGLSWSSISSFEYSPDQWYKSYIEGIRAQSKEMDFGNYVDKRLQTDPAFLPCVERYPVMQHPMKVKFQKVMLVGYADGFDHKGKRLKDDKTGKKPWDQKRADETGQLTMYLFMLYFGLKIHPEEMRLFISWLPTVDVKSTGMLKNSNDFKIDFRDNPVVPIVFETKRDMRQLLDFGQRIKDRLAEMQEYVRERQQYED